MNHAALLARLHREGLGPWAQQLEAESVDWLVSHGDYPRWSAALASLPALTDIACHFDTAAVTIDAECADSEALRQALQGLMPWRKGPYSIADVFIDCEWRSDFKWDRVSAAPGRVAGAPHSGRWLRQWISLLADVGAITGAGARHRAFGVVQFAVSGIATLPATRGYRHVTHWCRGHAGRILTGSTRCSRWVFCIIAGARSIIFTS